MSADRFRRAQWRVLLATMFCYLFYYTGRQTFGFAIPGIQRELGVDKVTLGWASTALLWCYAIGQIVNGNLGDKFGGRRMMSVGAVLSCGLNWVVSLGTGIVSLVVPWAVNGFAQSMGWAPGSRVLSNWWSLEERGKAYGFYVFAAGMSSVLTFVTSLVVVDVLDLNWRWIFRLPVLLLLVGGVVYYLIVRDDPRDLGFSAADQSGEDQTPRLAQQQEQVESEIDSETSFERYVHVLRNTRFMIASVAIGFQNMARYGLLVWVPVHFLGEGYKDDSAGKWVSISLPVGMAIGALANGWLSDRLFASKRWPAICLFMTIGAIMSVLMYFVPKESTGVGLVVLFLCGFFVYGPQPSFWALSPDLLGPRRTGTGTGVMNFSAYLLAGLGEPLIGWATEAYDETGLVFLIVGAACAVCALISLFIRR